MKTNIPVTKKVTYLLAWLGDKNGIPTAFFEASTAKMCREQSVIYAGMTRGDHTVVAFCDYIHGDDFLDKNELQKVASSFLDGTYLIHTFDFTE